jgi:hypothetical protein
MKWAKWTGLARQAQQRLTLFFLLIIFISINAYFLFLKNLIIFTLIPLLSFILFRETLLNDGDFLVMCLIFEDVFLIHL